MKPRIMKLFLVVALFVTLTFAGVSVQAATTITTNQTGYDGGFYYSFWTDGGGYASMTLNGGGNYSTNWVNCSNFTAGKGWRTGANRSISFTGTFNGGNNGYLAIYGWTTNPLIEYYIIENYGSWTPPGAASVGTINSDGGTYNLHRTERYNQPSIIGTATFSQYWSVRTSKRSTGTVTTGNHFSAWQSRGWNLGSHDYQIVETEGYQSSGNSNITVSEGGINPTPTPTNVPSSRSAFTTIQAEEYNSTNSSTIQTFGLSSGGSAVGYIENGNTLTYNNIDFGSGATSFKARVATSNSTSIQIRVGSASGTLLGTLSVPSTGSWDTYQELTTDISNVTGVNNLVLVFAGPVNVDSFVFTAAGGTPTSTAGGGTSNKIECEDMIKSGQYTGNISSPFNGVALYANNDLVKFTYNLTKGVNNYSLRGCSSNSNMARVDLRIAGQTKGTFYYGGSYPAVYTINNVSSATGNQEIQLVVTADNGQWDAYIDYLEIN